VSLEKATDETSSYVDSDFASVEYLFSYNYKIMLFNFKYIENIENATNIFFERWYKVGMGVRKYGKWRSDKVYSERGDRQENRKRE